MTALVELRGVTRRFKMPRGHSLTAASDVSFTIQPGKSLGLVGESGSGKTTVGRCLARLLDVSSGSILFEGKEITRLGGRELRQLRARIRVVFQEPLESLDPHLTVGQIIAEPLRLHGLCSSRTEVRSRVSEVMSQVGLHDRLVRRKPGELSGGQQQRVGIARAISTKPSFVVLDEPTSALDVSVRAQIIDLLLDLQRSQGYSYLFISHDLSTVQYSCSDIAVMYRGRIVEQGPTQRIFAHPLHPYTELLLSSILSLDPNGLRPQARLSAEIQTAGAAGVGCSFAPRCSHAIDACRSAVPALRAVGGDSDPGERDVACIRAGSLAGSLAAGSGLSTVKRAHESERSDPVWERDDT
jgi:oligopeptide/dipeptide ABC transporter ATP-binding protein